MNYNQLLKIVTAHTLLKIDIEGGEYELFTPKYVPLLKKLKMIVCELHTISPQNQPTTILSFLNRYGFDDYNYKNNYLTIFT